MPDNSKQPVSRDDYVDAAMRIAAEKGQDEYLSMIMAYGEWDNGNLDETAVKNARENEDKSGNT